MKVTAIAQPAIKLEGPVSINICQEGKFSSAWSVGAEIQVADRSLTCTARNESQQRILFNVAVDEVDVDEFS